MAKKVISTFKARIVKNQTKGGAWLATVTLNDDGIETSYDSYSAAWANVSAAKRWLKEVVQTTTPRKSIKMVAGPELDAKEKPVNFSGEVSFKRDV